MKLPTLGRPALAGAALLLSFSTHAALVDQGSGLIYDDVLDITWLADANLAASNTFGVTGIHTSGTMNWDTANNFIDAMNAEDSGAGYLGVNTWQQASASGSCTGYQCGNQTTDTEDELGYQFYQNFGATQGSGMTSGTGPGNAFFINVQDSVYWTGTELVSSSEFGFATINGDQFTLNKTTSLYVWAVAPAMSPPMQCQSPQQHGYLARR